MSGITAAQRTPVDDAGYAGALAKTDPSILNVGDFLKADWAVGEIRGASRGDAAKAAAGFEAYARAEPEAAKRDPLRAFFARSLMMNDQRAILDALRALPGWSAIIKEAAETGGTKDQKARYARP